MIVKRRIDIEELEQAAGDICKGYCRYPLIWDEDAMQIELCESDICASCPMTELMKNVVAEVTIFEDRIKKSFSETCYLEHGITQC